MRHSRCYEVTLKGSTLNSHLPAEGTASDGHVRQQGLEELVAHRLGPLEDVHL